MKNLNLNLNIKNILNNIKDSVKESIKNGATLMECAQSLGKIVGNDLARLIICDLALDLGKKEEVKKYLATFGI